MPIGYMPKSWTSSLGPDDAFAGAAARIAGEGIYQTVQDIGRQAGSGLPCFCAAAGVRLGRLRVESGSADFESH